MARTPRRNPPKSAGGGSYATDTIEEAKSGAASEADASDNKTKGDTEEIHRLAIKRWQAGYDRDRENIDDAYEDLEFLEGDQWPQEAVTLRENEKRPVLTANRIPQFVRQITGDMRLSRPGIKVVPVDSGSDKNIANIRAGLIRYIENRSDAQAAYYHGGDQQVAAGLGHWRVIKEYVDESTFNQELRIVAIEDGLSVIWDPDAILPNKEDAKYCFVPVDMSHDAFKEKFPDATVSDFEDGSWSAATNAGWCGTDYVRVAEYWVKKPSKRTLVLLPDGKVEDVTDDPDEAERYKAEGARVEVRDSFKVCRYLISYREILEGPVEWPGRFIPIIRCPGEETRIGRKTKRRGIIRFAKDPQRTFNYGISAQAEVVALQPKAPFIGTEDNFKDYQAFWNLANVKAFPYLPYKPDPRNGGQQPSRVPPPVSSQGVSEMIGLASENMKGVIGIYDAGLGARSNETSGIAIQARDRQGDVGSFVYQDNWGRAIRHTATIVNDLIPHVYDVERTIRVLGEDGKEELIKINQAAPGDGLEETERVLNDVTIGAYDVVFRPGPSFTTAREEQREGMTAFMQAAPQAAQLFIDLLAEAQDWPHAEKIGKRLSHLLPEPIRQQEAAERGEQPQQMPPNPQAQAAEQAKAMEFQALQLKTAGELQKLKLENEGKALDNERRKLELAATVERQRQPPQGEAPQPVDPLAPMRMEAEASVERAKVEEAWAKAATAQFNARKAEIELAQMMASPAVAPAPPNAGPRADETEMAGMEREAAPADALLVIETEGTPQ